MTTPTPTLPATPAYGSVSGHGDGAGPASRTALPGTGPARMFLTQARSELRRTFRSPESVAGMMVTPCILYALFGLPNAGEHLPAGTDVGLVLLVSFACYGVVSSSLFEMCAGLANERRCPWLRRMRTTALPRWAYFGAKLVNNAVVSALIAASLLILGALCGVDVPLAAAASLLGIVLLGTLTLAPAGMALGYLVRPKAATVVANLLFLPLSFCSGFFYPLAQTPTFVRSMAPWLPTYHYGQLAWQAVAPASDVQAFTGRADTDLAMNLLVVGAWFVGGLTVAAWAYARDVDRERGE